MGNIQGGNPLISTALDINTMADVQVVIKNYEQLVGISEIREKILTIVKKSLIMKDPNVDSQIKEIMKTLDEKSYQIGGSDLAKETTKKGIQILKGEILNCSSEVKTKEAQAQPVVPAQIGKVSQVTSPTPFITDKRLANFNNEITAVRKDVMVTTKEIDFIFTEMSELKSQGKQSSKEMSELEERKSRLNASRQKLIERHDALVGNKIEYVKKKYPHDPVYALAIPQTLSKHNNYYSVGTQKKMDGVCQNGILFDENRSATGIGPKAHPSQSQWGINEMGDRGLYFSEETPAYLSDDLPWGIHCQTTSDINGVSLDSIAALQREGFTNEQIDSAYDRLQREHDFIQHDGLYPKSTEVVFMRSNQTLHLVSLLKTSPSGVQALSITSTTHDSWHKGKT